MEPGRLQVIPRAFGIGSLPSHYVDTYNQT